MRVNHRILLTCAFLAVVAAFMALRPAPTCAIGNIHIIIVRSTTVPEMRKAGDIWRERLEETLTSGKTPDFRRYGVSGALESAISPGGLGRNDVETFTVLEGMDARPEHILRVCIEVSQKAEPDDAIIVFVMSCGAFVRGNDGVSRHALAPVAEDVDDLKRTRNGILRNTILSCLTHEFVNDKIQEKNHRLVVLITDSSATQLTVNDGSVAEFRYRSSPVDEKTASSAARAEGEGASEPSPKGTTYLKKFLEKARGTLNINSCGLGENALLINECPDSEFEGSLFINAFCRFATNGFYLDSELNPDDFFKLLSVEYKREILDYYAKRGKSVKETLTRFDGTEPERSPYHDGITSLGDVDEFYDARREKMTKSGEFDHFSGAP